MHLFVMNVPIWIQTSNLGPLIAEATAQPTLIFNSFSCYIIVVFTLFNCKKDVPKSKNEKDLFFHHQKGR